MLGFKVTSKGISTSSSASHNSSPWTRFLGESDEFFNFRAMSVPQAQHKLGTIGEIYSVNFLCGPVGLYDIFTRQKTKALFPLLIIMARLLRSLGRNVSIN